MRPSRTLSLPGHFHNSPSPSLTSLVKEFFLETFSQERHLSRKIEEEKSHGRLLEAAYYALDLRRYEVAFTLYNQAVANGNWRANIPAAELAESLGDYQKELEYRSQAIRSGYADEGLAGIAALRLGRTAEAQEYFRRLREEE